MKIEKLDKYNIKEFIRDMKLDDSEYLECTVEKNEFYGVKKDDVFCLGFNSLTIVDTIAILHYSPKMSNELFYECIDFLNKSLVAQNHLIVELYNKKYIELLDDKYRCKEMLVNLNLTSDNSVYEEKSKLKEKIIDIEMKSIKYNYSKDLIVCNLVKQNIQDEKLIFSLHEYFNTLDVANISFVIYNDCFEYFETLNYECVSKSYVIRN